MPSDIATIDDHGQLLLHFHPGQMQAWESEARFVAVMSGTQGGKCVPLNTSVHMADGTKKPICQIVPGDEVFCLGSDDKVAHATVSQSAHMGVQKVYKVITDSGRSVRVTENHPLCTSIHNINEPIKWVPLKELSVGDYIAAPLKSELGSNGFWTRITHIIGLGEMETWDIEVPGHQNFIADDIFCHNTSWGPFWLWREIQRRGPGDYMIVAPAYPLLSKKCLPEFLKLFKRHLDLGSYNTQSKIFTFSDDGCQRTFGYIPDVPTQVFFCHAQDPESLESATAKAAWLDEAGQKKFKLGSWEAILRRLSIHQGRVLITTTPYDLGWLKQKIYDKRNDPAESIEVIRFDSTANPTFPREEWERAMRDLPRWKFDMFYRAIFTRPAGMIYDCFQEDRHKVKPFKVPDDWPRYLGMDFGAVNTAGIFLAKEPNSNRLFAYREYKAGGKTMALHVKDLLDGEPCHPLVCGGAQSEENWRMECRQAGLMIYEPPIKEVEVGIDRVYGAFQRDELFIFDNCTGLLQDIKSYSRELDDMGEPTEKIAEKETYHYADALRYIISKVRGPKVMLERDGTPPRARESVKNSVDSAARGTFTKQRPGRGAKW